MGIMRKMARGVLYSRGIRVGSLDGFERMVAGILGTPDRVPLMLQPYIYAMNMHGLSTATFFREPGPFIHASRNTAEYFGVDAWAPVFDFYNIELEALGQELVWHESSEPDVNSARPLVGSEAALDRLRPPVPGRDGRMPYVLEAYRRYIEITGAPPTCYCCSPFTMAVLIRGYVNIIRDMRRNPSFVHRLLEFLSMEVVVPWIDKMAEVTGAALVVMSDAWASAPNVKTDMIREYCLPYAEKVIRATGSARRTVLDSGLWGERAVPDPREMLDIKMDMMVRGNRFRALRPLYLLVWNEDYEEVGVALVREYADERKVCLMLNLRPTTIWEGPPVRIAETVRSLIRQGAGKGRFALLLNLIPAGTPVENVHAAVAAVKQYGTYPIARDLESRGFRMPSFEPFEDWYRREGLPV